MVVTLLVLQSVVVLAALPLATMNWKKPLALAQISAVEEAGGDLLLFVVCLELEAKTETSPSHEFFLGN